MKTPFCRRLVSRFNYPTLLVIIMSAVAAVAVPVHSLNSNSWLGATKQDVPTDSARSTTTNAAKVASYSGRTSTTRSSAVSAQASIATYAADCTTARTTFYLGETVCAKTDGVTLPPAEQWWVNWILLSNNTVVHGGQGQTDVTTNPQTFSYAPTTTGSYKVSLTNLPNDISQLPAGFTVVEAPTLATYQSDCMVPKTRFNLGETICIKVSGLSNDEFPKRRVQLAQPDGFVLQRFNVTDNSQTFNYTIPGTITAPFAGTTIDHRGTWIVALINPDADLTFAVPMNVSKSNLFADRIADLHLSKILIGDPPRAGGLISFQIYVTNMGPDPATTVTLTDATLPNTTFHSFAQDAGTIAYSSATTSGLIGTRRDRESFGFRKNRLPYDLFGDAGLEPVVHSNLGVSFNCVPPSVGGSGATVCTADGEFKVGDTAVFTAVYQVSSNLPNGAVLTDENSASVDSTTDDPRTTTNSSSAEITASNPSPSACTLTCPGNITQTAALGQSGATVTFASPATGGTCTSVSVVPASGSFFGIGTTVVTASTENNETCTFTVTVNPAEDNQAPTITCPADITVSESSSSANAANVTYNVTATDNSGPASVSCDPPSGSSFPIGTREVICTATDAAGNSASCTFNVTVNQIGCDLDANSPPPTPNVASLPTITRACSVTLLAADDPTATDACGATISGDTSNDRTYDVPGTYTVTWTYTDSAGHTTTQNQTIIILADNTAPVPDASSLPTVTGECTASITGDPPTASDNCGGSGIEGTALDPLSYNTVGTHTVRWQFTDAAGNSSIQNQTVVVTDSHAPTVTLSGPSSVTIECHAAVYTDAGATATDNCSPAPTPTITSNNVNPGVPGTYTVVWTATDAGGNSATATRTVTVVDTTKPVLTINGASTMTVECHTVFTDPGASASDSCDTSVPVNVSGSVNANAVGTYTLQYTAADDSGNAAVPMTRTVNVVDTTAPAVTLNGAAAMTVILGTSFTDPGATANDSCVGSLPVTVSGAVNPNVIGTYTLTYSATDGSNNTGTITRTVNVIYNFTGFFSPVANDPVFNEMKAGQSVPMKFSLDGNQGLGIVAANSPSSIQIACPGNPPINTVSEIDTLAAGNSGLTYDSLSNQYKYVWKTENSWSNTCRQFVLRLNDGTTHVASFKFKP